jgi:hypothetical protein
MEVVEEGTPAEPEVGIYIWRPANRMERGDH